LVVIYAENRSFNNLFAEFPGLQHPLSAVAPERSAQRDRDGSLLKTLPKIPEGLVPKKQVVEHREYLIGPDDLAPLPNAPFALSTPDGDPLPHGLVTRDLVHAFYNNQLQINGGRNDGFVAWGDSGALVMGHYGDVSANLRLYQIAREFTLCDNFFMGAFGGSYLNHQYLIAAQPSFYPDADKSVAKGRIAITEDGNPTSIRLKLRADSPASAMDGQPQFVPNTLSPDFWAVNTIMPPYAPTGRARRRWCRRPTRRSATCSTPGMSTGPGMPAAGPRRSPATAPMAISRHGPISSRTTSPSIIMRSSRPAPPSARSGCAMAGPVRRPAPIISSPMSRRGGCLR
jgi:acid phosphatase